MVAEMAENVTYRCQIFAMVCKFLAVDSKHPVTKVISALREVSRQGEEIEVCSETFKNPVELLNQEFIDHRFSSLSSSVVEAGSLKGRLTVLRYCWICSFLTGD